MQQNDQREECLRLLVEFVQTGDIDQAATATGTILAYLNRHEGVAAQAAALEDLETGLAERCEQNNISGPSEDRHVAIEDAMEKMRTTLEAQSAATSPLAQ